MSRPSILILKTGEALAPVKERYGDFEDWIARGLGCRRDEVAVADIYRDEPIPKSHDLRGVVITGSPQMVTERPSWSENAAAWIAEIVSEDALPVLGLCYGHQLIAHGLGGEVGTNPNGREMGTVDVTFLAERLPDEAPLRLATTSATTPTRSPSAASQVFEAGVFPAHMSHVESVLRPPPGARVLARTALDPHSVIEFGPRQWGVQFHPEFDRPIIKGYIDVRREIIAGEGLDPDAMSAAVVDTPDLTGVLSRFAALVDSAD